MLNFSQIFGNRGNHILVLNSLKALFYGTLDILIIVIKTIGKPYSNVNILF